jgi:uncharacterized protein (TIGR00251 family)
MSFDLRQVLRESKGKVLLPVRVQPSSRQNKLIGVRDNSLLLKVTAPPVEGAANEAVIEVLAKALRLPKSTFTVQQGAKSRDKMVGVNGVSAGELCRLLEKYFCE